MKLFNHIICPYDNSEFAKKALDYGARLALQSGDKLTVLYIMINPFIFEGGNPILGNLVFADLNTAPPIRPLSHASFTTWHFSNKLRLGVRCDSAVFTQEAAQELIDMYADRVVAIAAKAADRREADRVAA